MKTKTVLGLLIICGGILTLENSLGNSVFASSMNLTMDSPTIALDLASKTAAGDFGESSKTTISVTTDNPSGYTISVSATNGSSLIHTEDANLMLTSIEAATDGDTFAAPENTSLINKWGYKPNKLGGVENTNFLPAPSAEGDVLAVKWFPSATADEYDISIGARINVATQTGSYTNTFVISAIPNAPVLDVVFDGNGLFFDNDTTKTSNIIVYDAESSVVGGDTVYTKTILDGTFKTPGDANKTYKFRGWSEDPNAMYATYADEAAVVSGLQKINGDETVTLYAVWSQIYTLQYDGNGADNANGMGTTNAATGIKTVNHTNVAQGDTFDLFASNFKREGYGFVGWSLDADAWAHLTDDNITNDPIIYGPNELIVAPAYQADIMTLKAVWAPAETVANEPVYLQGWRGCDNLTATLYDSTSGKLTVAKNSITALTDQRDNQVYAVAKLADENCWLIENLRLDNSAELSTSNTNLDLANSSLPLTNIYKSDPTQATVSNYLSRSSSGTIFSDQSYGWCAQYNENCVDQSRLNTSNITSTATPTKTQNIATANAHMSFGPAYTYGNYYNWYSATAGYGTYSTTSVGPTAGDICPTGWRLPYGSNGTAEPNIGGTKGGFSYLDSRMGGNGATRSGVGTSNNWRAFPNNFVYSGYANNGAINSLGGYGAYWSASANSSNYAYYLHLTDAYMGPGVEPFGKYIGLSVRCVAHTHTDM